MSENETICVDCQVAVGDWRLAPVYPDRPTGPEDIIDVCGPCASERMEDGDQYIIVAKPTAETEDDEDAVDPVAISVQVFATVVVDPVDDTVELYLSDAVDLDFVVDVEGEDDTDSPDYAEIRQHIDEHGFDRIVFTYEASPVRSGEVVIGVGDETTEADPDARTFAQVAEALREMADDLTHCDLVLEALDLAEQEIGTKP